MPQGIDGISEGRGALVSCMGIGRSGLRGMNFTGISRSRLLGRVLRAPLRLLPPALQVPVMQGRLKGKWWVVGSRVHGYWLGSYEWEKRIDFERAVPLAGTVFDIGANVGYYTLLASEP